MIPCYLCDAVLLDSDLIDENGCDALRVPYGLKKNRHVLNKCAPGVQERVNRRPRHVIHPPLLALRKQEVFGIPLDLASRGLFITQSSGKQ